MMQRFVFLGAIILLASFSVHSQQCQSYYEGCGSCVADGIWGSLRHDTNCTLHCDKVCGAESAKISPSKDFFTVLGKQGRSAFLKKDSKKFSAALMPGVSACTCSKQEQDNCSVIGLKCAAEVVGGQCQKLCN
jgi:hypothetical protein